jgi:hypothetical protein
MRVAQELVFHENGPNGYPLDFVPLHRRATTSGPDRQVVVTNAACDVPPSVREPTGWEKLPILLSEPNDLQRTPSGS